MTRIEQTFKQLAAAKQVALITFVTVGDPDLATTVKIMHTLVENGADILELGVPFSDPMADGQSIQRATERALDNKTSLLDVLQVVTEFRKNNQATPLVLMGYLNPIYYMGYNKFADLAKEAGVDGVLTVDSPIDYSQDFQDILKEKQLDCIFLLAPTTDNDRIAQITANASGFVYYVSLKGVTGSAQLDTVEVMHKINNIKKYTSLPIAVGFGIKDAASAKKIAQFADGVVVGSSIVDLIEQNPASPYEAVGKLAAELKSAIS